MVALHHRIQREQYFDASRSQIGLHLLPTAIGYMIASYQMAACPHLQRLLSPLSDSSSMNAPISIATALICRTMLSSMIQWCSPQVVTAPFPERMNPLPVYSKVSPLIRISLTPYLRIEQILLGGCIHNSLVGISVVERVQMLLIAHNIDPERSSDPG